MKDIKYDNENLTFSFLFAATCVASKLCETEVSMLRSSHVVQISSNHTSLSPGANTTATSNIPAQLVQFPKLRYRSGCSSNSSTSPWRPKGSRSDISEFVQSSWTGLEERDEVRRLV